MSYIISVIYNTCFIEDMRNIRLEFMTKSQDKFYLFPLKIKLRMPGVLMLHVYVYLTTTDHLIQTPAKDHYEIYIRSVSVL